MNMTREQEVGPYLDHLVAHRVMGWLDVKYNRNMNHADGYPDKTAQGRGQREPLPSFSTNGCAALAVMRHLQDEHKSGFYLERYGAQKSIPWIASFMWTGWEIGEGYPSEAEACEGQTMAEAVCRAALAFVEEVDDA